MTDDQGATDSDTVRVEVLGLDQSLVGHWKFENEPSMLADSSGNELTLRTAKAEPSLPSDPRTKALVDFCHVLLNANEFIYVD